MGLTHTGYDAQSGILSHAEPPPNHTEAGDIYQEESLRAKPVLQSHRDHRPWTAPHRVEASVLATAQQWQPLFDGRAHTHLANAALLFPTTPNMPSCSSADVLARGPTLNPHIHTGLSWLDQNGLIPWVHDPVLESAIGVGPLLQRVQQLRAMRHPPHSAQTLGNPLLPSEGEDRTRQRTREPEHVDRVFTEQAAPSAINDDIERTQLRDPMGRAPGPMPWETDRSDAARQRATMQPKTDHVSLERPSQVSILREGVELNPHAQPGQHADPITGAVWAPGGLQGAMEPPGSKQLASHIVPQAAPPPDPNAPGGGAIVAPVTGLAAGLPGTRTMGETPAAAPAGMGGVPNPLQRQQMAQYGTPLGVAPPSTSAVPPPQAPGAAVASTPGLAGAQRLAPGVAGASAAPGSTDPAALAASAAASSGETDATGAGDEDMAARGAAAAANTVVSRKRSPDDISAGVAGMDRIPKRPKPMARVSKHERTIEALLTRLSLSRDASLSCLADGCVGLLHNAALDKPLADHERSMAGAIHHLREAYPGAEHLPKAKSPLWRMLLRRLKTQ